MMSDDMVLVRQYAQNQSESAFATLVQRHVPLVYSVALREARDPHLAEEITQAVFIILARKAGTLSPKTILSGWLYRTTQYVTANTLHAEYRRVRRETEAHMESIVAKESGNSVWQEMLPLLDEGIRRLRAGERDALVLRYFENRSLREVAVTLGVEERAAQKRVARSLEKLRGFFLKRGLTISAVTIAGAVSANSIQAAPAGLAVSVLTTVKSSTVAASTLMLVKGALQMMGWAKAKTALLAGGGIVAAVIGITVVTRQMAPALMGPEAVAFSSFGPRTKPFSINMDFQGTNFARSTKSGLAAIGVTANDFWNYYMRDDGLGRWRTFGFVTNLFLADGTPTTVGMTIANAPGAWSNPSFDEMYKHYLYPLDGGNATVTVTNLPAGVYDVLLYSADCKVELFVGGVTRGIKRTRVTQFTDPEVWIEGKQYARFANLPVNVGQPMALVVRPGRDGYAIFSGMQIVGRSYARDSTWVVSGTSAADNGAPTEYRGRAEWFVPQISGKLSSIEAAIQGSTGRLNFFVAEDGSDIPGKILERFASVRAPERGDKASLLELKSRAQPLLRAGVKYWFCAEPADTTTFAEWFSTDQLVTNSFAYDRTAWSWNHAPAEPIRRNGAFAVNVKPENAP
jgi:RNA polymerase sigma factor (sigma-70 family)